MCGKPNPDTLETCQFCGARLKPLIVTPSQQPPVNPPAAAPVPGPAGGAPRDAPGEEAPAWLVAARGQPDATAPDEGGAQAIPDWLARLRVHQPDEEAPAAPDVPVPKPTPPAPPPAPAAVEELAPGVQPEPELPESDWLNRIRQRASEELPPTLAAEPDLPREPERPQTDWLSRLRPTEEEAPRPETPVTDEEADWLARLRESKGLEPPPPLPPPAPELRPQAETRRRVDTLLRGSAPPPEPVEQPEVEIPDWLAALRAKETGEALPPEQPAGEEDWLARADAFGAGEGRSAAPPAPDHPAPEADEEELPDWLTPTEGAPEWLTAMRIPKPPRPDLDQFGAAPDRSLQAPERRPHPESDWLAAFAIAPDAASPAFPEPPPPTEPPSAPLPPGQAPAAAPGELPGWLAAMRPAELTSEPRPAPIEYPARRAQAPPAPPPASAGDLAQAAIPPWLAAMRPLEASRPSKPEPGRDYVEPAGPLAGMRGLLQAEPVVALPQRPAVARTRLEVSDVHAARAELLRGLLQEQAGAAPAATGRKLRLPLERWLVALILLAAVLAPIVLGSSALPRPENIAPETLAAGNLINELPQGQPVLLAFEYDPASAAELSAPAGALVEHLMIRGLPLVVLSTRPAGPALAAQVLEAQAEAHRYAYGANYVNLGFVPGNSTGLSALADNLQTERPVDFAGDATIWAQPPLAGVQGVRDFALVVVISATPEGVRQWMEQVWPLARETPFVAVISAGAEPLVQPYVQSAHPQLAGLLSGFSGAAAYEQLNGRPGAALGRWDSFGYGLIAATAILFVGILLYGVAGALRRDSERPA